MSDPSPDPSADPSADSPPYYMPQDPIASTEVLLVILLIGLAINGLHYQIVRTGKLATTGKPSARGTNVASSVSKPQLESMKPAASQVDVTASSATESAVTKKSNTKVGRATTKMSWKSYWRVIKALPENVYLRLAATVLEIAHLGIEITSGPMPLPAAAFQVSDNVQLFVGYLVRNFLLYRASKCVFDIRNQNRLLRFGGFALAVLYLKSMVLMNVLGEAAENDFEYPDAFLYYLPVETAVFDVTMSIFSTQRLISIQRMVGSQTKEATGQRRTIQTLFAISCINVFYLIFFAIASTTFGAENQTPIIMVINSGFFACSIWYGEFAVGAQHWMTKHSSKAVTTDGSVPSSTAN